VPRSGSEKLAWLWRNGFVVLEMRAHEQVEHVTPKVFPKNTADFLFKELARTRELAPGAVARVIVPYQSSSASGDQWILFLVRVVRRFVLPDEWRFQEE